MQHTRYTIPAPAHGGPEHGHDGTVTMVVPVQKNTFVSLLAADVHILYNTRIYEFSPQLSSKQSFGLGENQEDMPS
jgi:hypothetical protein